MVELQYHSCGFEAPAYRLKPLRISFHFHATNFRSAAFTTQLNPPLIRTTACVLCGITDTEALHLLATKLGSKSDLADALKVSAQRLSNWYSERGISSSTRKRTEERIRRLNDRAQRRGLKRRYGP